MTDASEPESVIFKFGTTKVGLQRVPKWMVALPTAFMSGLPENQQHVRMHYDGERTLQLLFGEKGSRPHIRPTHAFAWTNLGPGSANFLPPNQKIDSVLITGFFDSATMTITAREPLPDFVTRGVPKEEWRAKKRRTRVLAERSGASPQQPKWTDAEVRDLKRRLLDCLAKRNDITITVEGRQVTVSREMIIEV